MDGIELKLVKPLCENPLFLQLVYRLDEDTLVPVSYLFGAATSQICIRGKVRVEGLLGGFECSGSGLG